MKKLNHMVLVLLAWLFVCVLIYLITAWIKWDPNPGKWEPMDRGISGLIASILLAVSIAACTELSMGKEK